MAGSRKAEVYETFHKDGLDAAMKKGNKLGLKAGTVKSWCSGWQGHERAAPRTTRATHKVETKPVTRSNEFEPWFKHSSRQEAERHRDAICNRSGCHKKAFHIIEENGRFAVAPAHVKGGPIPTFEKGDIVFDTTMPDRRGKVIAAGPEQTEVRYADKSTAIVPNYYLHKFEKEGANKSKTERVRTK